MNITIKIISKEGKFTHCLVNAIAPPYGSDFFMDINPTDQVEDLVKRANEEGKKKIEDVKNAPPKIRLPEPTKEQIEKHEANIKAIAKKQDEERNGV